MHLLERGMKNAFELFVPAHKSVEGIRSVKMALFIGFMGCQYAQVMLLNPVISSAGSMKGFLQVSSYRTKISKS